MSQREGVIKDPRKKKHVAAALNYLAGLKATDVVCRQKGHVHLSWRLDGRAMAITLSATPKNAHDCAQIARRLIRRRIRDADQPPGAPGLNAARV